ncbi:MAG: TlpA family protein disulfide reductase [Campylobacter sp.]|nr:TlpA family protein disulfide reductase [Campylobacter sp.]
MNHKLAIIAFILIFIIGCDKKDKSSSDSNQTIQSPQEAVLSQNLDAPFSLKLNSGEILNIKKDGDKLDIDSNNTAILFAFFTSWCPPCKAEIPALNALQLKQNDKLKIIGVMLDEDIDKNGSLSFIKDNNITYDISFGKQNATLIKTLGEFEDIPYMKLILPDGSEGSNYIGVIPLEMLENDILRLL